MRCDACEFKIEDFYWIPLYKNSNKTMRLCDDCCHLPYHILIQKVDIPKDYIVIKRQVDDE